MTIQINDKGPAVFLLQARLQELGFDPNGVDGSFGSGTAKAVKAFQTANQLQPNGIAGDETIAKLNFDPNAEIPSGFPGVSVSAVWEIFSKSAPLKNINQHLPVVLGAMLKATLQDRAMVLMALASIRAETSGFEPISEGRSKFNTAVRPFDMYDNRTDLGNQGPPDGERFKGRGFIQLTGRANYEKHGRAIGLGDQLLDDPELANDPDIAARLLASFIGTHETAIRDALSRNDLPTARRLVNGGSHGLDPFTAAYRAGERLIAADLILRRSPAG